MKDEYLSTKLVLTDRRRGEAKVQLHELNTLDVFFYNGKTYLKLSGCCCDKEYLRVTDVLDCITRVIPRRTPVVRRKATITIAVHG